MKYTSDAKFQTCAERVGAPPLSLSLSLWNATLGRKIGEILFYCCRSIMGSAFRSRITLYIRQAIFELGNKNNHLPKNLKLLVLFHNQYTIMIRYIHTSLRHTSPWPSIVTDNDVPKYLGFKLSCIFKFNFSFNLVRKTTKSSLLVILSTNAFSIAFWYSFKFSKNYRNRNPRPCRWGFPAECGTARTVTFRYQMFCAVKNSLVNSKLISNFLKGPRYDLSFVLLLKGYNTFRN